MNTEIPEQKLRHMIAADYRKQIANRAIRRAIKISEKQLDLFREALASLYENTYVEMTSEEKRSAIYRLLAQNRKQKEVNEAEFLALHSVLGNLKEETK
ncbi:MAG: hypothetical protein NT098_01155 [Candidatus Parcubacteria bacterium]|nr:hypothetical protein [Candidatus Parcubacteria bacterium]